VIPRRFVCGWGSLVDLRKSAIDGDGTIYCMFISSHCGIVDIWMMRDDILAKFLICEEIKSVEFLERKLFYLGWRSTSSNSLWGRVQCNSSGCTFWFYLVGICCAGKQRQIGWREQRVFQCSSDNMSNITVTMSRLSLNCTVTFTHNVKFLHRRLLFTRYVNL